MGIKIKEEMSAHERCRRLIHGLSAGDTSNPDHTVALNFSHLAQAVGMVEAEKLCETLKEMREITNKPHTKQTQLIRGGLAIVKAKAALEACKAALPKLAETEKKNPPQG